MAYLKVRQTLTSCCCSLLTLHRLYSLTRMAADAIGVNCAVSLLIVEASFILSPHHFVVLVFCCRVSSLLLSPHPSAALRRATCGACGPSLSTPRPTALASWRYDAPWDGRPVQQGGLTSLDLELGGKHTEREGMGKEGAKRGQARPWLVDTSGPRPLLTDSGVRASVRMAKHLGLDSSCCSAASHFLLPLHFLSAHPAHAILFHTSLPPSPPPPPLFFSSLLPPSSSLRSHPPPRWPFQRRRSHLLVRRSGLSEKWMRGRGLHLYINIYIYIFFFFTIVVVITIINIIAMKRSKEAELRRWLGGRGPGAARQSSPSLVLTFSLHKSRPLLNPETLSRPPSPRDPSLPVHLLSS